MKVKVEKFTIRHDGNKYILGSIFDMDKKEAEKLIEKGYISIVEEDNQKIVEEVIKTEEETINSEEKVEVIEESLQKEENSEVAKKNKTSKKK